MKKLLVLLAVAMLPAASGCCCARLCPFCPCNWFNRAPVCAAAVLPRVCTNLRAVALCAAVCFALCDCAPAPLSALSANVMPQYVAPQMMTPGSYVLPGSGRCQLLCSC